MAHIDELRNIRKRLRETIDMLDLLIGTQTQVATVPKPQVADDADDRYLRAIEEEPSVRTV
jgi:hypothetical protein